MASYASRLISSGARTAGRLRSGITSKGMHAQKHNLVSNTTARSGAGVGSTSVSGIRPNQCASHGFTRRNFTTMEENFMSAVKIASIATTTSRSNSKLSLRPSVGLIDLFLTWSLDQDDDA